MNYLTFARPGIMAYRSRQSRADNVVVAATVATATRVLGVEGGTQ